MFGLSSSLVGAVPEELSVLPVCAEGLPRGEGIHLRLSQDLRGPPPQVGPVGGNHHRPQVWARAIGLHLRVVGGGTII